MITRLLSTHIPSMLIGSGIGFNLQYVLGREPYVGVGAALALVLAGFLVWAVLSED